MLVNGWKRRSGTVSDAQKSGYGIHISIALHKTVVTALLTHCNPVRSHGYILFSVSSNSVGGKTA